MEIEHTLLPGVEILHPRIFGDERGYFYESYSKRDFDSLLGPIDFCQDNQSRSCYGVVRGLHFQTGEYAQSKLIRVVQGTIKDVAVDIRPGSPTFGKHVSIELSSENHLQVFIPQGFAHGFSVLSEVAVVQYKTDRFYAPGHESAIAWNDPALAIDWGVPAHKIIVSQKDSHHPLLANHPLLAKQ